MWGPFPFLPQQQMLLFAFLLTFIIDLGYGIANSGPSPCFYESSSARYDLSRLGNIPGRDNMGNAIAVNICTVTSASFAGCDGGPVPAHLIRRLGGSCHAVGVGGVNSHTFADLPDALGVLATFDTPVELCSGGEEEGGVSVRVTCGDQPLPTLSMSETKSCHFEAEIKGRDGCPLECARDPATGAVCGGPSRGTCQGGLGGGLATCVCAEGLEGPLCTSGGGSAFDSIFDGPSSGSASTVWVPLLGLVGLVGATLFSQQYQKQEQQEQRKQSVLPLSDGRLLVGGVAALLALGLLLGGEGGKTVRSMDLSHHRHLSRRSNPYFPLSPHAVEASLGGGMLALPTAVGVLPPRTRPFPAHLALTNFSSRRCVGCSQAGDGMGSFPSEQYPGQKGPEDPRNHFCELRDVCIVGGKVVYYMDAITAAAAIATADAAAIAASAAAATAAAAVAATAAGASEEGDGEGGENGGREAPSLIAPRRRQGRGVGLGERGGFHPPPAPPDLVAAARAAGLDFHFSNWAFRQEKPLWSPTLS